MTSRPDFGSDYGQELWESPAPPPTELEEEREELYGGSGSYTSTRQESGR